MAQEPKYRAPALEKGLAILEALAHAPEPMSIVEITTALSRSRNEIFRMLQVLEETRYIERVKGGGYVLTNRLFALGMQQPPIRDLLSMSLPVMHALAQEAGQSCHLAVASGAEMVVIARVEAPGMLGFAVRVGYRRPLHHSASGRTLLAFQTGPALEAALAEIARGDPALDRPALEEALGRIRARGHVTCESPAIQGITDISAPIAVDGTALAALTVPFVSGVDAGTRLEETVPLVVHAADAIVAALEPTRIDGNGRATRAKAPAARAAPPA